MDSSSIINLIVALTLIIIFLIAALPLKNFLEVSIRKKEVERWNSWLNSAPDKSKYSKDDKDGGLGVLCDFCNSNKQFKTLQKVLDSPPEFGFINNTSKEKYQFSSYFCRGCGTELYREKTKYQ